MGRREVRALEANEQVLHSLRQLREQAGWRNSAAERQERTRPDVPVGADQSGSRDPPRAAKAAPGMGVTPATMPKPLQPRLSLMLTAFMTNENVERTVRRQQKRDPALIQLADEIHEQRRELAKDIRDFLYEAA